MRLVQGETYPTNAIKHVENHMWVVIGVINGTSILRYFDKREIALRCCDNDTVHCVVFQVRNRVECPPTEENVDTPEQFGRARNSRGETIFGRPGHFRLVNLHPTGFEKWKDRHAQYKHAHTAKEMSQGSPEQHAAWQSLQIGQNRGPGGRET